MREQGTQRFIQPVLAAFLKPLSLLAVGLCCAVPARASIDVGDYNGSGPATRSSFSDGDTLGGISTVKTGVVTFNGNVTNLASATLEQPGASGLDRNFNGGSATIFNQGTWNFSNTTRGGLAIRAGTITIRNQGLFYSTSTDPASGGNFYTSSSTPSFINEAGATFRQDGGSFEVEAATTTHMVNEGTLVATNGGSLTWSDPQIIHSSTAGSIFDSTDGTITMGGSISNLSGTAVGNPLSLGTSYAYQDLSILNITGQGLSWSGGSLTAGNKTMKNEAIFKVTTASREIFGSAGGADDIFWNAGTFTLDFASGNFLLNSTGPTIFTNSGSFVVASNSSPTIYERPGAVFCNSGTVRKEGSGTATFTQPGSFENHGGTVIADTGSIIVAPSGGPNLSSGGNWISANGGTLQIGGPWSELCGTAVNKPVFIGGATFKAVSDPTILNFTGEGMQWSAAVAVSCNDNTLRNDGNFEVTSASREISGVNGGDDDIFWNAGTFTLDFASGNFLLDDNPGPVVFTNSGTFLIASNSSPDIYQRGSGNAFINSGILRKEGAGTVEFVSSGRFENYGGTVVADTGTITVAPPGGPNGDYGSTWISTNGGTIQIGGAWSCLSGTAVHRPVFFGGATFTAASDPTLLNITGEGMEWSSSIAFSCNDNTLKNEGNFTVSSASREISGVNGGDDDIFWNAGTFTLDFASGNFLLDDNPGPAVFTNSGTFLVASNSSPDIYQRGSGNAFHNSGTVRKEGAGTADFIQSGSFQNHGGTVVADTGTININPLAGPNVDSGGTWTSVNGGALRIGGPWSGFSGTAVNSPVGLAGTLSAASATTVINVGGEGLQWTSGRPISHSANVLVLEGTVEAVAGGQTLLAGSLGGYVRNAGHFVANYASGDLNMDMQNNSQFRNAGTYEIQAAGATREVYARSSTCVFHNEATGVMTQNVAATFQFSGGGPGTFRNEGTIVMNAGTLAFTSWNMSTSTVNTAAELLEGTYIADGGSMNLPGVAWGTISTNAKVVLGASGNITELQSGTFATLYGSFGLHRGRQWTRSGGFTSDSSANFEFGLDSSGSDALLTITGNSTVDGVVDVVDLDGDLVVGHQVVITNSGGTTLTDNGIAKGTMTSSQGLDFTVTAVPGVNGYVILGVVPGARPTMIRFL